MFFFGEKHSRLPQRVPPRFGQHCTAYTSAHIWAAASDTSVQTVESDMGLRSSLLWTDLSEVEAPDSGLNACFSEMAAIKLCFSCIDCPLRPLYNRSDVTDNVTLKAASCFSKMTPLVIISWQYGNLVADIWDLLEGIKEHNKCATIFFTICFFESCIMVVCVRFRAYKKTYPKAFKVRAKCVKLMEEGKWKKE